jgi:hypothetical protein
MVSHNPLATENTIVTGRGVAEPGYATTFHTPEHHLPTPLWRSIFAGVFIAFSLLAVLSVLGVAIGATVYRPTTDTRAWGTGAFIWALLSAIIAFGLGGFVAGRTIYGPAKAAPFHGFLVWAVAIPLLGLAAATGLGSLAGASSTNMMWTPSYAQRMDTAQMVSQRTVDANGNVRDANGNVRNIDDEIKADTEKAAWGTFVTLILGLGAATIGGMLGGSGLPKTKTGDTHPTA